MSSSVSLIVLPYRLLHLQISATNVQPSLGAYSLVFSGQLADEEH